MRRTLLVLTILVTAGACSSSGSSHAFAPSPATSKPPDASTSAWCSSFAKVAQGSSLDLDISTDPSENTTSEQLRSEAKSDLTTLAGLVNTAPREIRSDLVAIADEVRIVARTGSAKDLLAMYKLSAVGRVAAFLKNTCHLPVRGAGSSSSDTTVADPVDQPDTVTRPQNIPDPCGLVTQAEAGAFLGGPAQQTDSGDAAHTCAWTTRTAQATLILQVSVFTNPFFYRADRSTTAEKLTGIGDRAYIDTRGIGGADFGAQKGDKILLLSLGGGTVGGGPEPWKINTAARRQAFVALGKLATTRL